MKNSENYNIFRGVDFTGTDWGDRNVDIAKRLFCDPVLVSHARRHFGMAVDRRIDWSGVDFTRPVKEIAADIGCSAIAVAKAKAALGMTKKRCDFEGADWAKTNVEIAEEYGVTVVTVAAARKRLSAIVRKPGRPKRGEIYKTVTIRLTDEEFQAVEDKASELGITNPEFVRRVVKKSIDELKNSEK